MLSPNQDLYEIGNRLSALKIRREDADYESTATIQQSKVNDSISKAKELVELIKNYVP
jgi:hypothetical protein